MSARETLIRSVYSKLSQNQMEKLVDAYAHELAEKQRDMAFSTFGGCYQQSKRDERCGMDYCEACDRAKVIDLIDPTKESDG